MRGVLDGKMIKRQNDGSWGEWPLTGKGGPFHMAHILPDPPGEASAPNRVSLTDDSAGQPCIDHGRQNSGRS